MKTLFLGITMMAILSAAQCQESNLENGTLVIMRSTGYGASLRQFAIFIDGDIKCKIKNKRYLHYALELGNYEVAIQMGNKELKSKTARMNLSVAPNTNYYLEIDKKNKVFKVITSLSESDKERAEIFMTERKQANCIQQ